MKKFTLLLICLAMSTWVAFAQKTVTGVVISAEDGEPVLGASVVVKGSNPIIGVVTDLDGNFEITVPQNATDLEVSYVGFNTVTQPIKTVMKITLSPAAFNIDEVVVTALGVSREKKALGYSVSEVKGSEMMKSRGGVSNPINSLAGKVAGLQITGGAGQMGGSSKILIRGATSISGNNQPLFVIDGVPVEGTDFNTTNAARGAGGYDYGNLIQDINPDDIDNISVLKGPNASALYGSRASNGVIMITTKKGTKEGGIGGFGVTFNSSIGFETVNKLPKMQNEYGGGYGPFGTATINGKTYKTVYYGMDESWGPKYDGSQTLSWYDLAKWEAGGKVGDPTTTPWQPAKNDIDSFFKTGVSFTNNISISQATENVGFRMSYTNSTLSGYMPNSQLDKNVFNAAGNIRSNKYLELFTNVTYINQAAKGRPETGYGDNNVMQKFIQWGQRQVDMKELKEMYIMPDGTQAGWNRVSWSNPRLAYSNNPYWSRYMNYQNDTRDRLYGNIGAKVNATDYLKLQYKVNLDYFNDKQYERNAVFSQEQSRYFEAQRQQHEINHEFMAMFSKHFNDFTVDANLGANLMYREYRRLQGESVGGLTIPEFYNFDNSKFPARTQNFLSKKSINSVFASATIGYKNFAYLDLSVRNDWSSTLPKDHNSYLYPSVTGSFLFGEFLPNRDLISFGKVRLGWAEVGNDTDPYRIMETYSYYANQDGNIAYVRPTTLNNPNLKPERTSSFEVGLEMAFFKNRANLEVTYYTSKTRDQIMPLALSGSTGYNFQIINAGSISNEGIEIALGGNVIQNKDFEWNVRGTFSSNKNTVNSLIDGVNYYRIATAPFRAEIGAYSGDQYGRLPYGQIMGTDYVRHENGQPIVDANGRYRQTNGNVPLGKVYPDMIAGITNSFRYKNFDFSFLFDGQWGSKFFSTSYMWGMYSGMLEETAGLNELGNPKRDPVANGGGVILSGVLADGTPNTKRISMQRMASDMYSRPASQNVMSGDFIKLREITLGYTVPLSPNCPIKGLKITAYGRNLLMFGPATKHFDPEMATTSSGNTQGIEGGILPSVASYGLNVGVKF